MSEPYLNETDSRWIAQEFHMNTWMQRVTGDEGAVTRYLRDRRAEFPERIYRAVEEITQRQRFVRVPANEAGKPLPKPKKSDILDSSAETTEGQVDGDAGDERGPSGDQPSEAGDSDGQVPSGDLPV